MCKLPLYCLCTHTFNAVALLYCNNTVMTHLLLGSCTIRMAACPLDRSLLRACAIVVRVVTLRPGRPQYILKIFNGILCYKWSSVKVWYAVLQVCTQAQQWL